MADTKTSAESDASALTGAELVRIVQGGVNAKATIVQIKADVVVTGITAAGTTQGTATALTGEQNYVATTPAGTGVVLPAATVGVRRFITNEGANDLLLYPAVGATINALAVNLPMRVPPDETAQLIGKSATAWRTVP